MRLADYVISRVYDEGIKSLYTVTGRGILYLTDAVARHKKIKSISVHHEQAASYAAYGYAKYSGNMGCCLVSTGCAATNAMTGVLCAWQDNVPCVFISGQNMLKETVRHTGLPIRTYGSQEADIVSLVKPITKYAVMIENPNDIQYELEKAFCLAFHGRRGPVWIDIPLDIQNARVNENELTHYSVPQEILEAKTQDVEYVKNKLEQAERPVILIGGGIRLAGAEEILKEFLNRYPIPLVYSPSAVDVIGAGEVPLSIGAVGSLGGSRAGNFVLQNSDYLLVIGSRLSPVIIGQPYDKFARDAEINVVDIDEQEHKKNIVPIQRKIIADAKSFISKLSELSLDNDWNGWNEKCIHWKEIFPKCEKIYEESEAVDLYYLGKCLSETLPEHSICLTDAGFEELIIPSSLELKTGQRCIHPVSQGSMGFSLPAAVGVSCATDDLVVSVSGDGSIMMNLQELQTIQYYNFPIKIIICNNDCYAVIRKRQQDLFRDRTIGTDERNGVSCPNFEKVAEAFDIPYMRIDDSKNLREGIKKLFLSQGAMICEIRCVKEQKYLHNSYARGKNGKIQKRSLEDQSPFMDRDVFLREMVVQPVDYE